MTQPTGLSAPPRAGTGVGGIIALVIGGYVVLNGCAGSGVGGSQHDAVVQVRTSSPSVCWSGAIGGSTKDGCGDEDIPVHDDLGIFSSNAQNQGESGSLTLNLVVSGDTRDTSTTTAAYGIAQVVNH